MIRQARERVADALRPVGIAVHPYPPAATQPPCLFLVPGTPYRALTSLHGSVDIRLDAVLSVAAQNPESLDDYLDATVAALLAADLRPDAAVLPPVISVGMLAVRIPIMLSWTE